jgi:hypothetical protein
VTTESPIDAIGLSEDEGELPQSDFVKYVELLSRAHEHGLERIETGIVQTPTPENGLTAICTATVTTRNGVFSDCADANPQNVRSGAELHVIRVALTRAKARALRDAINFGGSTPKEPDNRQQVSDSGQSAHGASRAKNPKPMTEPQRKRLFDLLEKQGTTGAEAERHLCLELGVVRLSEATVSGASSLIRKLTGEPVTKPTTK